MKNVLTNTTQPRVGDKMCYPVFLSAQLGLKPTKFVVDPVPLWGYKKQNSSSYKGERWVSSSLNVDLKNEIPAGFVYLQRIKSYLVYFQGTLKYPIHINIYTDLMFG